MSVHRVLVVEDEREIRDLIVLHLKRERLEVDAVGSAEEAQTLLNQKTYSVLVLDWMLPGTSGVHFTKAVRNIQKHLLLSILMVTAKADPNDVVEGLEAGADDYLTKPFDPSVLVARVRALLRRQQSDPKNSAAEVRIGELCMNRETYEVKCASTPILLTPSEFKLLLVLAQNSGRVLTRDSLIEHVQGEGVSVVGRTVDTHVFGLRKKLGACADVIETVRGVGYRVKSLGT